MRSCSHPRLAASSPQRQRRAEATERLHHVSDSTLGSPPIIRCQEDLAVGHLKICTLFGLVAIFLDGYVEMLVSRYEVETNCKSTVSVPLHAADIALW